ncbi:MAG TPA: amidase [Vicinamibacterales bacterium]|nr:amidase [Vicinamibacterales bacterium]
MIRISEIAPKIAAGKITSEKITENCLATITELNPKLNAFITVTADAALARAREADKEIAAGRYLGTLHGIPISLKDLIDCKGTPTTAGSLVRKDVVAGSDAPVTKYLRDAGAVFVGKTNLHEFAFGTTTEDSGFGLARNPHDPSRSPGGSSGGSAIAVATGMSLGTVGTDTGGSIRIPAAACGIVGLKPEWGRVSASGVVPLSRQLDHVGPLAASVADAWLLYNAMQEPASRVSTLPETASLKGLRFGRPAGYLFDRLDADVEQTMVNTIEFLQRRGATVSDVQLPHSGDIATVYLHLVLADAAAYHARTLESRPQDYTPNVRLRLEMARYVLAEDYIRALRGKAIITKEVDRALHGVDVLICPALSIPAPPIGATTMPVKGGPEAVRTLMLRCTQPFNVSGHPAISLPCGKTPGGMPIGLQLVGPKGRTAALVQAALAVEKVLTEQ